MKDIRIAAVCMNSEIGQVDKNLARIEAFAEEASGQGVDIVCFPELSITGYALEDPLSTLGNRDPDGMIERVLNAARENNLILIVGTMEVSENRKPFISQLVAGPEGIMGIHRKCHLSPQEKERYQAGGEIEVYSSGISKFGVQLCYEAHFPEISTVMALKGADIVFMPHASPRGTPEEKLKSWLRHMTGRAFDNAMFIVACNQVGETMAGFSFPGVAVALNPAGHVINSYRGKGESMMVADLRMGELEEIRKHRLKYFIPNRRPELYGPIISD